MNSHLRIEINGKVLSLPQDFSIDIEEKNPVFNNTEMFSYPVKIPFEGNRCVLQNLDDINSDLRPVSMEHLPMRMAVDGVPFRSGTAVMSDNEEVDGSMSLNMDASLQSFEDLIGDLSCRDVPVKDEIVIGEKIGNVKVDVTYKYHVKVDIKHGGDTHYRKSGNKTSGTFDVQALGFSYPGKCVVTSGTTQCAKKKSTRSYPNGNSVIIPEVEESYINTSTPYPTMPYCNARVCYKHKGLSDDGTTSDSTIAQKDCKYQYEDLYPYWVLDANRQQSGICFYVLYFLDCLFAHLGVSFDNKALLAIEDFKHLCFYTTHCKYEERPLWQGEEYTDPDTGEKKRKPFFTNLTAINNWAKSRGCGGELEIEDPESKEINSFTLKFLDKTIVYTVGKDKVRSIKVSADIEDYSVSADVMQMLATSDNFPDKTVKAVITALENSFGIKFHYDYEQKKVTAYLVRDVFRSQDTPIKLNGQVISMHKMSEKIIGVRMVYAAEGDDKEQQANIKNEVDNYDTDYNYIDYPEDRTVTDKTYTEFFDNLSAGDKNVYIDQRTGNAYRIKVNGEAKSSSELKPVLFEVGAFKGVEIGDCSIQNEDYIKEFISNFQPISFNDVNYFAELEAAASSKDSDKWSNVYDETDKPADDYEYTISGLNKGDAEQQPILCAYIDEDMEHEFVKQRIRSTLSSAFVDLYVTQNLWLVESYNPSGTDDGNSPLQHYDWGMAIALMRGGGSDAVVQNYDYNYDGFGNSKWRTVSGKYALSSDSMDAFGNQYDYNGTLTGIGGGERFSLKIRAYKQMSWTDEIFCDADEVDEQTGAIKTKIRSRGLFDTFMAEYAHFLLNRKLYKIKMLVSAAALADIQNHWKQRFSIDGKIGYVNKVSYSVSVLDGVKEAEIEFYAI